MDDWLDEIEAGLNSWEEATGGLVTATRDKEADDCDDDTKNLGTSANVVRFATVGEEMRKLCRKVSYDDYQQHYYYYDGAYDDYQQHYYYYGTYDDYH